MKKIQKKVQTFCSDNGMTCSPENRALDLVSEIGEVAKELNNMTDYGTAESEPRAGMKDELGDALFSLLELANTLDVDLESALEESLAKYERRLKKGSAGSEVE